MGLSLPEAIDWIKRECSIFDTDTQHLKTPPKTYSKPVVPIRANSDALHTVMEERGFDDPGDAVEAFKLRMTPNGNGVDVVYPFISHDKQLVSVKTKPLDYDGIPQFTSGNQKMILFGWQAVGPRDRTIWITEGEWDAIALWYCGHSALSIPTGASGMTWIANEFHNLDRFEEIIVCTDMDAPGEGAAQKIMERFGDRCIRVRLPEKDANDVLKAHGKIKAKKLFNQAYDQAKWQDPETLHHATDFWGEVQEQMHPSDGVIPGWSTLWEKLHGRLLFSPSELCVISGINGHGKSMWLSQVCLDALKADQKVCVASMEMRPSRLLERMVMQACGVGQATPEYEKACFDWMAENLWLFIDSSTTKQDVLLSCFKYAHERYGCSVFVIDSLSMCGMAEADYDAQKLFVEKLVDFKNRLSVNILLVAHLRKGADEYTQGGKFDVKGTGAITDLCDMHLNIFRNKRKENHLAECLLTGDEPDPKIEKQWDVLLGCDKNRNGDWEGRVGFAFDPKSFQYLEKSNERPRKYVQWSGNG